MILIRFMEIVGRVFPDNTWKSIDIKARDQRGAKGAKYCELAICCTNLSGLLV